MDGIETAYYLVHSMGSSPKIGQDFAEKDKQAARNFCTAADRAGLRRVIYLSGLGEHQETLSKHLRSRQEVGRVLASGSAQATELRAGVIICYANVRRLKRAIISVPVLTPKLSSYWVQLVTPISGGVVHLLIQGLKNNVVCREKRIRDLVPVTLIPMREAISMALEESH